MGRLRDAWQAFRGYTAAQDLRAPASWAPSAGSANVEVGAAAATLARRARDAVRNDPYATRIVDLWTGNAVGSGITTRWPGLAHADAELEARDRGIAPCPDAATSETIPT